MSEHIFIKKWEAGISEEVSFWSDWIKTKGLQWPDGYAFKMDPGSQLQNYIAKLLNIQEGKEATILDVGAGPATFLGKIHNGKRVKIIAIDPLATAYDKLWKDAGIKPPVQTIEYAGEKLLGLVSAESVDMAYSRNALDHSYDPLKIITSMIVATRLGGCIFIELFENEAKNENYKGFHQWNFALDKGELHLWNQDVDILLNPVLAKAGELQTARHGERGISITIRKTNEFSFGDVKSVNHFVMA